jgi:hypothetical protein
LDIANAKLLGVYPLGHPLGLGFNIVFARPFGQPAIYASGGPIIALPCHDGPHGIQFTVLKGVARIALRHEGNSPSTIESSDLK